MIICGIANPTGSCIATTTVTVSPQPSGFPALPVFVIQQILSSAIRLQVAFGVVVIT